jgi:nitroreductase
VAGTLRERDIVEVAAARHSIRRGFDVRAVPFNVVDRIVHCGLSAPSSKDAQPWRLHVVQDRSILATIAEAMVRAPDAGSYLPIDPMTGRPRGTWPSTVPESAEVLRQVPLAIFVENRGEFGGGHRPLAACPAENLSAAIVGYTFEIIGIGAAIQNMWLAAESMGLRGVFMGDVVIVESLVAEMLRLTGDFVGVLALGYSDAPPWRERIQAPDRLVWH